jgi:formylglycine-generating enzyme required for sulfatase activity
MVYVPGGSFYVGSGGTEDVAFYKYPTTTNPYPVNSEAEITVGTATDNLYYGSSGGDQSGPISAAFPKGYAAFYCMKYEISQRQYVDFLNTLTYTQQATRTANAPSSDAGTGALINPNDNRNGIDIQTPGANPTPAVYACNLDGDGIYDESNDGQCIACNYLSWADLAAYLDWSGLRPMTELEFEKSCRGTVAPVPNEYAWGTTGIAGLPTPAYTLSSSGLPAEVIAANYSITVGNAVYSTTTNLGINGPVRVGIFAATPGNTGRVTSGATYYGIMEMSGNLSESPVTVGKPEGRAFTGTHGNGLLDATGNANVSNWPGTDAEGAGFRGGGWNAITLDLQVSDRNSAASTDPDRNNNYGGRGVRSAP